MHPTGLLCDFICLNTLKTFLVTSLQLDKLINLCVRFRQNDIVYNIRFRNYSRRVLPTQLCSLWGLQLECKGQMRGYRVFGVWELITTHRPQYQLKGSLPSYCLTSKYFHFELANNAFVVNFLEGLHTMTQMSQLLWSLYDMNLSSTNVCCWSTKPTVMTFASIFGCTRDSAFRLIF